MTNRLIRRSKLIITIDGPAGSGKSTVARLVAKKLKVPYIDTGAMYRAVTLKALQTKTPFNDAPALTRLAKKATIQLLQTATDQQKVFLDKKDVTKKIRSPQLTKNVFYVAQIPSLRREMVRKQRLLGKKKGGVMEGRDIGTVVFPKAGFKFYLTADPKVRAKRRYEELKKSKQNIRFSDVLRDLVKRDETDTERKEGPLKRAKDAVLVDTSPLTIDEVVDKIYSAVNNQ